MHSSKFDPAASAHRDTSVVSLPRKRLIELLVGAYHEGADGVPQERFERALLQAVRNERVTDPAIYDDDSLVELVSRISRL